MKTKYFSPTELSTGRQNELDIAKGLAIIFMVWCHIYREMGEDTESTPGFIIDSFLGGPFAAPVFMLCMDVGICFSRRNDAATMLSRGIKLLLQRTNLAERGCRVSSGNPAIGNSLCYFPLDYPQEPLSYQGLKD